MAIQVTQVPMYTKYTVFVFFFDFSFFFLGKQSKIKSKQPNKNRQTTWKHERKMHMHEGMIPKIDKKSSKKSPTLDRKN